MPKQNSRRIRSGPPRCAPAPCSAASHGIHEAIGRILTLAGIATEAGWELWDADLPGKLDRAREAFQAAYDEAPQNPKLTDHGHE